MRPGGWFRNLRPCKGSRKSTYVYIYHIYIQGFPFEKVGFNLLFWRLFMTF